MIVKVFILVTCLSLVACQQASGKRKTKINAVESQGRTLGLVSPVLGLAGSLLGGGGGILGDYRPTLSGSASQSDMNGNGGSYGGYYGGYPAYGGYRPIGYPGLLNILSGFGGYPSYSGYGGYPSYSGYGGYGGYPAYGGYGGYGGYNQRPVQQPVRPSYASTNNNYGSAPLTNPLASSGLPTSSVGSSASVSPQQAAQLGQALGTLLRPLLSNGASSGSAASPQVASSLLSILG